MKKLTAANAAANAAAMALAATGTPHGRVPKRQAPTPPGLRDLSEAVLWAQTVSGKRGERRRRASMREGAAASDFDLQRRPLHLERERERDPERKTGTENLTPPPPLSLPPLSEPQEAFEEAAWARRAAELSDAEALESADAALERYDWRCSLLAELFDGVPVSEALLLLARREQQQREREQQQQKEKETTKGRDAAPRSLAETVRALEQEAAASTSASTAAAATASSSASASAAADGAASEFEALLSQLSRARTRAEVAAAERAYLSFRAKRRRRRRGGGQEGDGGEEEQEQEQEQEHAPLAVATKRRTAGPGLFEILLGGPGSSAPALPDPPAGPGLEL